ncbi:hypothetical protein PPERSA_00601 [Pseudocohnilembus persalinus]|uniref:7-dehydrocholesterol reductase n=1 Tax=Pseudocohnilembus persalinus TaxID=266149 RepID=A0A0V0QSU0_PSEPJ|nr:hypothetical protein PPERSA_00601 [Pseudocohnilembus persalinus]|eukprot:KRX05300.1 hypothetical protein PPERSA_00601 [Pseudocohnilembus persalinus]
MYQIQQKARYTIFPTFAIIILPLLLFGLVYYSSPMKNIDFSQNFNILKLILIYSLYAYAMLYPYSEKLITKGPVQVDDSIPHYNRNGFAFYLLTVTIQVLGQYQYGSDIFLFLMDNHILTLLILTMFGFIFVSYLLINGKQRHAQLKKAYKLHKTLEEPIKSNWIYQFYRGMDFHPKILGVDVKQLTNCRFGMMIWQILVLGWGFASYERFGVNWAVIVTTVLQTLYIGKFFYWEMGYFYTLDMTLDRAGFYICWGCIVFVPTFYTLASFITCAQPPELNFTTSIFILITGLISLYFNYQVDYQKQYFQKCNLEKKPCYIWGKKAEFLQVQYKRKDKTVESKLLLSGFWGMTRHMNYTFELVLAFCWCCVGMGATIFSLSYFVFLFFLLVSRVYRDEEKCQNKYGKYWNVYCEKVKYRLIPYLY